MKQGEVESARHYIGNYADCQLEAMLTFHCKRRNNDRKVLILKLVAAGFSCSEIGERIGISGTRVRSELEYSLRKLKQRK